MHSLEMIIALNERQAALEQEDLENELGILHEDGWQEIEDEDEDDLDFDADWRSEEFDEDYYTDYPEYFYGEDVSDYLYPDSDLWNEY